MAFRVTFGFNMQHYVVSRKMVEALATKGEFYQSPYPDYYAANALLLQSERTLVVPQPLVVIGISPKSFGYFYYNNRESEGDGFLKNIPEPGLRQRLEQIVLPGSSMTSCWLYAMEAVKQNFDPRGRLRIDYRRYRLLQVYAVYSREGWAAVWGLRSRLAALEGAKLRLRPILMTTMMLVASMIPIAFGTGPGSAGRAAMAKVIIGGQMLCLLLTLLVTPVAYSFLDDLRRKLHWRRFVPSHRQSNSTKAAPSVANDESEQRDRFLAEKR
jgi:hypothetical protein